MERLKNITEFVVVSNFENRAMNAGINKAQKWWKDRHHHNVSMPLVRTEASTVVDNPGELRITVLRAEDLYESRLSMLTTSAAIIERPYVIIECNQQRFRTTQADLISTNRHPQWTLDNGPFSFYIRNSSVDRLTVWIQQQDSLHAAKRNEPRMLGTCEMNVKQLIDQEQVWVPLRKDNKPVGQVLLQVAFIPKKE